MKFDVKKYEAPKSDDVNMEKTRANVGVFLTAYLSARTRCRQPREPKLTSNFSVIPPSFSNEFHSDVESVVIENDEAERDLIYLDSLFVKGFSAIQCPFKPDITERRKKVFFDRYINGMSVYTVSQRHHSSEQTVIKDAAIAIIQFASALELIEFK